VRSCGRVTPDRWALAEWLASCRIATVALASTGVEGMAVDEVLEARGCQGHRVPARHLQQALPQRHVPLPQGLTDLTGVTGVAISRALVLGERDPVHLARWREPRCARRPEAIDGMDGT
jgi:hypothetical protein